MTRKYLVLIGLGIGFMFFGGCAGSLSRLEVDYGTSHALAKQNQILNPEAGENAGPVYGLNGQAARRAVERYWKGSESQTATSAKSLISTGK